MEHIQDSIDEPPRQQKDNEEIQERGSWSRSLAFDEVK
jgi:hypothetical protein